MNSREAILAKRIDHYRIDAQVWAGEIQEAGENIRVGVGCLVRAAYAYLPEAMRGDYLRGAQVVAGQIRRVLGTAERQVKQARDEWAN